jgi:hypothetical protein
LRLADGRREVFESPLPDELQRTLSGLRRGTPI